jgi:hypothetical protein
MFEVPLFFTIMFLAACFLYRSKMKIAYVRLSYFLVIYIQISVLLKVLYQITIATIWVIYAISAFHAEVEVTIIKALFGHEHLKFGTLKEWEWTLLYEVSLLGSFGFAHMWRISKSIQQRCFTQHFDEFATDEERFVAVAKKENLVTLRMRMKRFVDLYNRGKTDAEKMEAALDVDRISSYKESFITSEFAPVIVIWILRFTIGL